MHEVLVNCLVKLAQEKRAVRLTDCPNMIIAVDWDVLNYKPNRTNHKINNRIIRADIGRPIKDYVELFQTL